MSDYSTLRGILGAVFSIDVGLSHAARTAMLEESLQNPEWRAAFQNELLSAVTDTKTSWIELLSNDEYEVFDTTSEAEARELALSLLWKTTFPDRPAPEL